MSVKIMRGFMLTDNSCTFRFFKHNDTRFLHRVHVHPIIFTSAIYTNRSCPSTNTLIVRLFGFISSSPAPIVDFDVVFEDSVSATEWSIRTVRFEFAMNAFVVEGMRARAMRSV